VVRGNANVGDSAHYRRNRPCRRTDGRPIRGRRLAGGGHRARRTPKDVPTGVRIRPTDLSDQTDVERLVSEVAPAGGVALMAAPRGRRRRAPQLHADVWTRLRRCASDRVRRRLGPDARRRATVTAPATAGRRVGTARRTAAVRHAAATNRGCRCSYTYQPRQAAAWDLQPRRLRPAPRRSGLVSEALRLAEESRVEPRPTAEDRFWREVTKTDAGCWMWTGCTTAEYGRFAIAHQSVPAQRFAWDLVIGPIPRGMELGHRNACPHHTAPVFDRRLRPQARGAGRVRQARGPTSRVGKRHGSPRSSATRLPAPSRGRR